MTGDCGISPVVDFEWVCLSSFNLNSNTCITRLLVDSDWCSIVKVHVEVYVIFWTPCWDLSLVLIVKCQYHFLVYWWAESKLHNLSRLFYLVIFVLPVLVLAHNIPSKGFLKVFKWQVEGTILGVFNESNFSLQLGSPSCILVIVWPSVIFLAMRVSHFYKFHTIWKYMGSNKGVNMTSD